ncbi:hypothetical protein EAF00_012009 [Botryotinia globosa]|nr:hypothetical protein EAF00_012009 [Botryotinia globosa]
MDHCCGGRSFRLEPIIQADEQRKRRHEYANTSVSSKAFTSSPSIHSRHFRSNTHSTLTPTSRPEVAIPVIQTDRATTPSTTPLSPPMTPLPTRLVPIMTEMLTASPFGISIPIGDRSGNSRFESRASQDRVRQGRGQDQARTSFQLQTRSQARSSEEQKREQNPLEDASLRAHMYGILRRLNPGMTDEKIWEAIEGA